MGTLPAFVPPISLVLATWPDGCISGLTAFRHLHPVAPVFYRTLVTRVPIEPDLASTDVVLNASHRDET